MMKLYKDKSGIKGGIVNVAGVMNNLDFKVTLDWTSTEGQEGLLTKRSSYYPLSITQVICTSLQINKTNVLGIMFNKVYILDDVYNVKNQNYTYYA